VLVGAVVDEDIAVGVADGQLGPVVVVLEVGLAGERSTMGAVD
jgi:hypothetical protein